MSWRDVSSSSNRSSTNDGNGGSMRAGGDVRGTGSGSGFGGMGGLTGRKRADVRLPRGVPKPTGFNIPQVAVPPAMPVTPIASPITPAPAYPQPGTVTDYFSQPVRMDPGIIAQMLKQPNVIGYRSPGQPKDQSRLPQMGGMGGRRGSWGGRNGNGWGGGGGGGW